MMTSLHTVAAYLQDKDVPIPKGELSQLTIQNVLHVIFGFAGGIALIVIARAAFRYTISQGEPQKIAKEKDTIIYAIVGLVISILAFSIVPYVIDHVK